MIHPCQPHTLQVAIFGFTFLPPLPRYVVGSPPQAKQVSHRRQAPEGQAASNPAYGYCSTTLPTHFPAMAAEQTLAKVICSHPWVNCDDNQSDIRPPQDQ
jgi:hypothetical protein